jgi:outer membrane receptor protein involved in Fe transport
LLRRLPLLISCFLFASILDVASPVLADDASSQAQASTATNTVAAAQQTSESSDASAQPLEEIIVSGHQFKGKVTPLALSSDPSNDIASVTVLSNEDIARQSLASNVDIFRSIPGVQVSDFGQIGLAQGITVRGWPGANDSSAVAFYLDGVQRNEPSGTGANGYLDVRPIIPEVLNGLTLVKGPFDTRYGGDFAQAGSAVATTVDFLPTSVSLSGGSYGHVRSLGTYGYKDGDLTFYTAVQGMHDDGYQRNSRDNQVITFSKLGLPAGPGHLSLSLQTYDLTYGSPGYLDLENLNHGVISPRSDVNNNDGGAKDEQTFIANYTQGDKESGIDVTAYADNERRHRFDTFTPYPSEGSKDKRVFYGASAESHLSSRLFDTIDTDIIGGVSVRHDDINVLQLPAANGEIVYTPTLYDLYYYELGDIGQTQLSTYTNVAIKPAPWLKLTGGVRYDWFDYDVRNTTFNSTTLSPQPEHVTASTGTASPKGGIAIQPVPQVTIYVNYGQSILSPDAWRNIAIDRNTPISILTSEEAGVAFNLIDSRLHIQVNRYDTTFSNEVTFVGLTAVNDGRTKRTGDDLEISAIAVRNELMSARLYGNYSKVSAHLSDGSFVPNVAKWVASYGLHADFLKTGSSHIVTLDAGQEWTGPQELDASPNTTASGVYSRVTGRFGYEIPELHDLTITASGIFYPGSRTDEFGFVLAGRTYVTSLPETRLLLSMSAKF